MRKKQQYQWEVSRVGGSSAKFIGVVYAPDEQTALKQAIEEFKITNPHLQKRLLIRRQS